MLRPSPPPPHQVGPSIVLEPRFAPCFSVLKDKLLTPSKIRVTARSSLVVRGADIVIEEVRNERRGARGEGRGGKGGGG